MTESFRSKDAADPRFHRRLFGELAEFNEKRPPCLIYVENGNYNSGYDLLALDYKMASDALIAEYLRTEMSNLNAPIAFTVRQTLELSHKALLERTLSAGNQVPAKRLFSHNLESLWDASRNWLIASGYPVENDRRYTTTDWMTTNFHGVDPSGDLFRFAFSKLTAYKRQKTYDRAGVYISVLKPYFDDTYDFLSHWEGVLSTQAMKRDTDRDGEEWTQYWEPNNYPKIDENHPWTWNQSTSMKST